MTGKGKKLLTPIDIAEDLIKKETVNHPAHYRHGGIEAIDVIEAFDLNFRLGNTVKYILRAGHKDDRLEDLKKAMWYLQREIDKESRP